jgi:CheY-like chemotaxis protein
MNNKPMILIVDDDADIREVLKMVLEMDGFAVTDAANGSEALQLLLGGLKPAVILLDLMMPDMDGQQFTTRLRAEGFARLPIVVMSGHNKAAKEAAHLEAAFCLLKPVEVDELLETMRRFSRRGIHDAA